MKEQLQIDKEGGSYECFICGQMHSHERVPYPWERAQPSAAGAQGKGDGGEEPQEQEQRDQQEQREQKQQEAGEEEDEEGPPAKRARP